MPVLQDWIHRLEVGAGARLLKWGVFLLALVLLLAGYNWRSFKNMAAPEAMDAAQLARNLAEGKGYTTLFIRPFSLHLVKNVNQGKSSQNLAANPAANPVAADVSPLHSPESHPDGSGTSAATILKETQQGKTPVAPGDASDLAGLKGLHPDLANPPVYPVLLAGLMKILPSTYDIHAAETEAKEKGKTRFWNRDGGFWWYPPDFFIALLNQALLLALVVFTYLLARWLFDSAVARLSALLLLGSELLWRFSVSGLSTLLLLVLFVGLLWCLALLERGVREAKWGNTRVILVTAGIGVLVGLGMLTRYSFGWVILPVMAFLFLFTGQRRMVLVLVALLAFAAVVAPWVMRNLEISGKPFGTAGFAVMESSSVFPEYKLARSLEPDFSRVDIRPLFWRKLLANSCQIAQNDLPKLGGTWVTAFFLVGLLVVFRNPALNRLRIFLLLCLGVLTVVQAVGRTQLSEDHPEINTENLLVLLVPLVLIYGVSLFYLLLDQLAVAARSFRLAIITVFAVAACLPMLFTFLLPRSVPIAYPPYYPPAIQQVAGWMKPGELMMSDMPWAVAWYGRRQCVWLTLDATEDPKNPDSRETFLALSQNYKPVQAIYLTPLSLDGKFLSQWVRSGEASWGNFIIDCVLRKEIPLDFPLHKAPAPFYSEQLFLSDSERWRRPGE